MSASPNQKKIHCLLEKLPSLCLKYLGRRQRGRLWNKAGAHRSLWVLRAIVYYRMPTRTKCLLFYPRGSSPSDS